MRDIGSSVCYGDSDGAVCDGGVDTKACAEWECSMCSCHEGLVVQSPSRLYVTVKRWMVSRDNSHTPPHGNMTGE